MMFHFPYTKRVPLPVLLAFRLLFVLLLMGLSRWIFYFLNSSTFSELGFWELLKIMFAGMRFDLSAIVMVNALLIVLLAVPTGIKYEPKYIKVTNFIYIWFNAIAIGLNLMDVIYFRFISKRTTSELFQFFGNASENYFLLLWQFLHDYWYMWVLWLVFIWLLIKSTRILVPRHPSPVRIRIWYLLQVVFLLVSLLFAVIAIRGGFQLKPIGLVNAGKYTATQNIPLVINTPFSIIKTIGKQQLRKISLFDETQLNAIYNPVHQAGKTDYIALETNQKPNIVILILESFGREKIHFYHPQPQGSITPFLDSLFRESLVFDGWANGRRSIESLPAILAGIPSLMPVDYPTSAYAGNSLKGLGTLLKEMDYSTAFFHGGSNGTMHFDASARAAGFDQYFGRDEYDNEQDFDGRWGIFDEAFFRFSADELSGMASPFAAVVFSLSSHHPFTLPDNFKEKEELSPFDNSIRYSDFALKSFFEKAAKQDWFNNTIFVITADHSHPEPKHPYFKHALGIFAVPMAIYSPLINNIGYFSQSAQHTDIMPTLLSLVAFDKPYLAFGNNVLDSIADHWHLSYINQVYQLNDSNFLLQFDGANTTGFFDLEQDSLLQHNLNTQKLPQQLLMEQKLKAIIQQYNNRMISNNLYVK
ncbi:MAG: sulfatase-like hydrolase/transferase [Bacteroidetes bacterium]|jgi:phosphoglycerol transferase MdoB-like AlkP superfamily enzyme|nr:sulfatase-like hydrolase/transferase [Bacteroidota bacterium]